MRTSPYAPGLAVFETWVPWIILPQALSTLAPNCFPGSSAEPAIYFRGRSLGPASGLSAKLTKSGRHPLLRAKKALQQARHVEIGIKLWKVNSETGWRDLNFVK